MSSASHVYNFLCFLYSLGIRSAYNNEWHDIRGYLERVEDNR